MEEEGFVYKLGGGWFLLAHLKLFSVIPVKTGIQINCHPEAKPKDLDEQWDSSLTLRMTRGSGSPHSRG